MYKLKKGVYEKLKQENPMFKVGVFAKLVGIKRCFTSQLLNRKRTCSKTTARCFAKAIDSKLEIEDIFEISED